MQTLRLVPSASVKVMHVCLACQRYMHACDADCLLGHHPLESDFCSDYHRSMFNKGRAYQLAQCDTRCYDCRAVHFVTDFYMVSDQLWQTFGVPALTNWEGKPWLDYPNRRGKLCFACFEKRLGRQLTVVDLKPVVCNARWRKFIRERENMCQEALTKMHVADVKDCGDIVEQRTSNTTYVNARPVRKARRSHVKTVLLEDVVKKYRRQLKRGHAIAKQLGGGPELPPRQIGIVVEKRDIELPLSWGVRE